MDNMNTDFLTVVFVLCLRLVPSRQFRMPLGAPPSPRAPWLYPCGGEPTHRYRGPPLPPSPLPWLYTNPYQDLHQVSQLVEGTMTMVKKLRTVYVREVFGNHVFHLHSLRRQGAPRLMSAGLHTTLKLPPKQQLLVVYQNLVRAAIFVHMVQRDHVAHMTRHRAPELRVTELLGLVEHGGLYAGVQVTGGLYQVLCRLRVLLGQTGELPEVVDSGLEQLVAGFSDVTTTATRHNRDFRVITGIQRLLRRVRIILNTIPP